MAFRFRLQQVLEYRRSQEEMARAALARETARLAELEAELARRQDHRLRAVATLEAAKAEALPAGRYLFLCQLVSGAEAAMEAQQRAIDAQETVVAQARQRLLARVQERRVLERLRQRHRAAWQRAEGRREQKEHDEMAVLRAGRRHEVMP